MKTFHKLAIVTGFIMGVTGSAHAGRILTPSLVRDSGLNQRLLCSVVNGNNKVIGPFSITIFRGDGPVANSANVVSMAPGVVLATTATGFLLDPTLTAYCVVEGKGISKSKTPVTLCVIPESTSDCMAAVSVP